MDFRHKDFPLRPLTAMAAEAVRCVEDAAKQDQMRALVFGGQRRWSLSKAPQNIWATYAAATGTAMKKWRSCTYSRTHKKAIEADRTLGFNMGVNATPTIFVGNRKLVGAVPYRDLAAAVRTQLK
ncbi:MAG: thioredoxin domain-containing protein [Nitrospinota bacterium]|nr:thioredoxin domain-containing protein [Nitrospinota bacterium]